VRSPLAANSAAFTALRNENEALRNENEEEERRTGESTLARSALPFDSGAFVQLGRLTDGVVEGAVERVGEGLATELRPAFDHVAKNGVFIHDLLKGDAVLAAVHRVLQGRGFYDERRRAIQALRERLKELGHVVQEHQTRQPARVRERAGALHPGAEDFFFVGP
jgi:hypothetical protein